MIAYFARLNYNYKGKYILSASIRQEGSTKFGKNYKRGTFPAVSVAWNIVEENFLKDVSSLSALKIRDVYKRQGDAFKAEYYTYMMNGLMTQLVRIELGLSLIHI